MSAPSRTLLFVDDEPRIIDGIRRMLRPLRDEWRVLTATSGPEALGILQGEQVDVVISDMRMPGMDGAELLTRVMKLHPNVVRIILSGQSDNESIMRSIGPTHQYLSKPCAPEVLRATLARACTLRDLLNHQGVAAIISRLSSLPSLPGAYSEVIAELQSREPSLPRIAQAIASDMGMSAKVLQLVNFSMFRQHKAVSSPLDAAMALGIDNLRSLVLTAGVFEQAGDAPAMRELWEHGKTVGTYAKAIALAEGLGKEQAELCFTAGVLHDCGRLVLGSHYSETIANQRVSQSLTVAERKRFGASHPQIGAYLLGLWGLPYTLVDAVAHHHRPEAFPGTGFTTLTAVHVAEALAIERFGDAAEEGVELNRTYLADIGMAGRLEAWRAAVAAESPITEPKP
jgi:HD-like signal output (HDOD) protein/CheY-like chemotaxis protein